MTVLITRLSMNTGLITLAECLVIRWLVELFLYVWLISYSLLKQRESVEIGDTVLNLFRGYIKFGANDDMALKLIITILWGKTR